MDESVIDVPIFPSLWSLFIAGCILWPGLYFVFWSFLIKRYLPYLACGTSMRLVSCIHAAVHFVMASIVMSRTYTDVFYADCKVLDQLVCFTFMYWFYDVVVMYISYCKENKLEETPFFTTLRPFFVDNPLIIIHHIAVVAGGFPLTMHYRFGKAAFMIACVHFTEISAPFLCLRKIFIRHGYTNNIIYRINVGCAVTAFFMSRIILFPSIYLIYAYTYNQTLWEVATSMYFGCHFVMVAITILQTTWFSIFMKTVLKDRSSKAAQNRYQQNGLLTKQNGHQNGRDVGHQKTK